MGPDGNWEGGLLCNWEIGQVSRLVICALLAGRRELYDILTNGWIIAKLPLCIVCRYLKAVAHNGDSSKGPAVSVPQQLERAQSG